LLIFGGLTDNEFRAAPIEMWKESFSEWAAVHGRPDDESIRQSDELEEFLRASVGRLKQLRDAPRSELSDKRKGSHAESILEGIFGHVARLVAFAEQKIAGGKMPRRNESAVLGRDALVRLLDDDVVLLDEAIKRENRKHPTG
jgi:hypothetical protein